MSTVCLPVDSEHESGIQYGSAGMLNVRTDCVDLAPGSIGTCFELCAHLITEYQVRTAERGKRSGWESREMSPSRFFGIYTGIRIKIVSNSYPRGH